MNSGSSPTPSPSPDPEDVPHYDEGQLGRAVRVSLWLLLVLAIVGGGLFWWLRRSPPPPPAKITAMQAPVPRQDTSAQLPAVVFTALKPGLVDRAGIDFVHDNGATGQKLLPESMGSGLAFFDFDGDGDQDLLCVNARSWPWDVAENRPLSTQRLYRNDGQGRFEDVTRGSGLDLSFYGVGVACGDYDNDGRVDVFLTGVGGNRLLHNRGQGRFVDVTAAAEVGGSTEAWSTSAAWIDYDRDGRLDLFVANYVKWSREIDLEVGYSLVGVGRAYGPPMNFQGSFSYLYHNEGEGRFADVSAKAGIQIKNPLTGLPAGKSLGVAPVDLDNDGWIDLVVANDTVQNFVLHNQRDGTFREIGALIGVAFDSNGQARGAMGIDAARYRNDDSLGLIIGNFANEMTALYVAEKSSRVQGLPLFTDQAIAEGIGPPSRLLLKFGIFFFDYDLDGRLDVLSANGHLEEEIGKVQQSQKYRQPAQLFWNSGAASGNTFLPVPPAKAGTDLFQPIVGRGSAFADIDGDGDLDVILSQVGGAPLFLRNDQKLGHAWVRFRLVGTRSNRDAIGAWMRLRVGGQTLSAQVMPTRSYLSQSELPLTFGFGSAQAVEAAEVQWPDGSKQSLTVTSIRLGALNVIEQAP